MTCLPAGHDTRIFRGLALAWPVALALASCSGNDTLAPSDGPASTSAATGGSGGAGGATTTASVGTGGSPTSSGSGGTTSGGGGSTGGGGAAGTDVDAGVDPMDVARIDAAGSVDGVADAVTGPDIDISPAELVFSAFLGMKSQERVLTVKNLGTSSLEIASFTFRATSTAFATAAPPATPLRVAPAGETTLRLVYSPPAQGMPGVEQGALRIASNDPDEAMLEVGLWGLSTRGEQGTNEPPLAQIVEALGYAIDVGGKTLVLGTGANPIGDEVRAQRFRRATPGVVTLRPVARYSPDEPIPYGYYTRPGAAPITTKVGTMRMGQEQTLLPGIEPGSLSDFDPGDAPFGLYGMAGSRTTYTEDALNTVGPAHAVRSYPLKDRAGRPIANAYLVGFEEAANGDYNDYVFVLGNVMPAP
jgi:hypothetical protein